MNRIEDVTNYITECDEEVGKALQLELGRQRRNLELIASENIVSPAVMLAMGTVPTNKYAEGYPGKRYYGGCQYVDMIEDLARERAKKLFGCTYVNVQPHSGAQANMAVQFAVLKPGDTIMGMNLDHGGHLTHGSPVNMSGKYFHVVPYGVDDNGFLDYDRMRELALECRPKMIIAGASAYARTIDFKKFREVADEVGAVLMVDMAHIAGLVAAGLHPSPIPYADVVTTTTHKTLRGPRGGMILCNKEANEKFNFNKAIFPGIQGGPLMHVIAAKAVCFEEDALPSRTLMLSYIINEGHSLPVVSLVSEDTTEFSQMYNGPAKGVELPASISLYRGDGGFTAPCGVSLNGETSLIMSKKNMSLRFRGSYGQETLQYDIFGGGATEFTNLLLRAGQDQEQTIIRNELSQSLCEKADMDVINQRSIFCVLYVNGEYSGIYTLKEKANKYLYAAVAGVDPDSVEVIEAPAGYDTEFYDQIIRFAYMNDMSLDENYEHLASLMDMDSLTDWLIMEGFCANTDVTSGNLRYCRSEQADGKWHFMFYDLDATFVTPGAMYANLLSEYGVAHIQVSSIAVSLMQNAGFKDRFLTRAAELLSDKLSNEAVINEISTMTEELSAEVDRDFARYGKDRGSWEWSLEQLLYLVDDCDWRQQNIDALCFVFGLSSSERSHYFGSIDGA